MFGTVSDSMEVNVAASEAWKVYGSLQLARIVGQGLPNLVTKVDVVHGDGGAGTIVQVLFAPDLGVASLGDGLRCAGVVACDYFEGDGAAPFSFGGIEAGRRGTDAEAGGEGRRYEGGGWRTQAKRWPTAGGGEKIADGGGCEGTPGFSWVKEKFTVVDDEKRVKEVEIVEGGFLDLGFTLYRIRLEVMEKEGEKDKCITKATIEYELKEEAAANVSLVSTHLLLAIMQLAADYLLNNNNNKQP
ncbi:S-norcoclaurine synthase 2 [Sesamum alatum]|uniref:S-norcoclaurine synthase 2 n=1 Tax=Sesamum alatum TaxID=300844 RepID=A0AAE2CAN2_9LAMI|nr:S-norcoclaurine synthase 2 [Sesamum alatum]